ncbi:MAG: YabP/YqfC family sporulation protein [Firmicutes bacterium]|nr:hypothetical protein [Clostridiales bacterium]MBQ9932197.1 YabP/YqfC family sporulation protein [Bacillota bacterium]
MSIKEEFLYDFSLNRPRILIGGRTGILDHVKQILLISSTGITADCGVMYVSLQGEDLTVDWIDEGRMSITGEIRSVEFFPSGKAARGEGRP